MGGSPEQGGYAGRRVGVSWWPIKGEKRSIHLVLYGFVPPARGKVLWHVDLKSARDSGTISSRPFKGGSDTSSGRAKVRQPDT